MRVTEQMVVSNFLRNISSNRANIDDLQAKLASNRKISKPSDNPIGAETVLRYKTALDRNEIFKKNVGDTLSTLETTFDTVDGVIQALTDLKTTAVAGSNTQEPNMLNTYSVEVDGVLKRVMDLANYKFNGKFIFAGTNTLSQPYSSDGTAVTVNPKGVDGQILVDLGGSQREVVNINGSDIFQGTKLFDLIISIRDNLKNQKQPTKDQMDQIDTMIDSVNSQFGKVGAITERFRSVQTQLDNENVRLQNYLGQENDIDLGDTIVKLTQAQTNLEAAFKSWSGVLQKTLFNFLS
jgi:flagellar hook-associated protein 3 FlgL